ncbi:WD40-repeat-containing domain protein [Cokeromyces recurvatus]|uniref:WD40-repeat-containing domain protein n=1 Tax=Cokeromyces recurvatus TaxID=90255 RepID=UPI0022208924|nr:WD40-repeat-containing domain protein [Cokeromyces recurvatus]KAI7902536.1 WD40-repeat-containing domain protein [Cokeromyces recurvatus]
MLTDYTGHQPFELEQTSYLTQIKQFLANSLSREERIEFINFLQGHGTCDFIAELPTNITSLILQKFTPKELCALRLVSKAWNKKIIHDSVWRPICKEYSIIPDDDSSVFNWNTNIPIYYDLFRRSLTMAKTWKTLQCKRTELKYHKGPVLSMLITHLTRIFTGDIDGKIHVWNAEEQVYVKSIQAHTSHVSCLASHEQALASGSSDKTICIHDIKDFRHILTLRGHEGPVTALAYSTHINGHFVPLISGSVDRTIRIWDSQRGICLKILHGQENTISSLTYCPSFPLQFCQSDIEYISVKENKAGYIVSGSSDHNIYLWDLKTSLINDVPEVISTIMETNGPITAMAVYDENTTECSKNKTINEYISARHPINIPPFVVYASVWDTTISVFSLPGLERTYVEAPNRHHGAIWSISVATIHSKILTTSGDRTAVMWDLKSPKKSITLSGFDSAVVSSAVSPQEEIICFGTEMGTIILLDLQEFV